MINNTDDLLHITLFKKLWILPQLQNIGLPYTEGGVNNNAESSSGGFGS